MLHFYEKHLVFSTGPENEAAEAAATDTTVTA